MENTIKLTAQQLFYLATLMNAKHLDYSYISAMGLVEDRFKVFESRMLGELADSEVVSEDFNGDIEIRKDVKELLEPLFDGNTELTIDICATDGNLSVDICKYHILGERVTRVHYTDGSYELEATDNCSIGVAVEGLFPEGIITDSNKIEHINLDEITHLISVKATIIGLRSRVDNLLKTDASVLIEREDNCFDRLDRFSYSKELLSFIKAVV